MTCMASYYCHLSGWIHCIVREVARVSLAPCRIAFFGKEIDRVNLYSEEILWPSINGQSQFRKLLPTEISLVICLRPEKIASRKIKEFTGGRVLYLWVRLHIDYRRLSESGPGAWASAWLRRELRDYYSFWSLLALAKTKPKLTQLYVSMRDRIWLNF